MTLTRSETTTRPGTTRRDRRLTPVVLAVALAAGAVAGCSGEVVADLVTFCSRVDVLREEDPFATREVATPDDMRDAFARLAKAASNISTAAPEQVRPHAAQYRAAVAGMITVLAPADYDPSKVDPLAYGAAAERYTSAAIALDKAVDAECPRTGAEPEPGTGSETGSDTGSDTGSETGSP